MSEDNRSCTCHPDDSPPVPCARRYAINECRQAELTRLRAELARVQQEGERLRGLLAVYGVPSSASSSNKAPPA